MVSNSLTDCKELDSGDKWTEQTSVWGGNYKTERTKHKYAMHTFHHNVYLDTNDNSQTIPNTWATSSTHGNLKAIRKEQYDNRHENTRWRAASEQYNLLLVTAIVKIYCLHNVLCSISSSSYYSRLKWPTSYLFASSVRQGVTNMSQYIMLKKLIISSATIIMAVDSDSGCT